MSGISSGADDRVSVHSFQRFQSSEKRLLPPRRIAVAGVLVLCLIAGLFIFRDSILYSLGAALVNAGPPQKADIAVVLAGDEKGNRILTAAQLCKDGYVSKVLVSGPGGMYGYFQSELAVGFAIKHGYPQNDFVELHHSATSTLTEARVVIPELRRLGIHNYLLVTSDYHTARSQRIYRREAPDLEEHTISAPDPNWEHGYWWKNREGRKLWLNESLKTIANYLGI